MLISFNSGNSSHVAVTVGTVFKSLSLLKPSVLTLCNERALLYSNIPSSKMLIFGEKRGSGEKRGNRRGHVPDTQAVSFATERTGWLHRKTEIQKEKLFSTPTNSTSLCWSFCFAFLCFFSPCFPSSPCFGPNLHAVVNLKKTVFARSPTEF